MINTDIDYREEIVVPYIKEVWKSIIDYEEKFRELNLEDRIL